MKDVILKGGGAWSLIAAIIITAMLCATAIFISLENNKTQWDIAKIRAEATKDASKDISDGIDGAGVGGYIY